MRRIIFDRENWGLGSTALSWGHLGVLKKKQSGSRTDAPIGGSIRHQTILVNRELTLAKRLARWSVRIRKADVMESWWSIYTVISTFLQIHPSNLWLTPNNDVYSSLVINSRQSNYVYVIQHYFVTGCPPVGPMMRQPGPVVSSPGSGSAGRDNIHN